MKRSAEYHTRRWYGEKKRLKRGKADGCRGKSLIICLHHFHLQCLIIYRPKKSTCISTPIPNYLSTYQLHQFHYSLFGEYAGAGGVEMRGKERLKMGGNHLIMTPMPNHLSTLKLHHNRVEITSGRAGEKKRVVWGR